VLCRADTGPVQQEPFSSRRSSFHAAKLDLTPVAAGRSPLLLPLTVIGLGPVEIGVVAHSTVILLKSARK
jgi:hypothetical protein